jgi:hypothetical protein
VIASVPEPVPAPSPSEWSETVPSVASNFARLPASTTAKESAPGATPAIQLIADHAPSAAAKRTVVGALNVGMKSSDRTSDAARLLKGGRCSKTESTPVSRNRSRSATESER